MSILPLIEGYYMRMMDAYFAHKPQPTPPVSVLKACRLIAHRGEHDNRMVLENSLAAFQRAADAGLWGIELDVRWTRDLVPVVFHDPDLNRLFSRSERIDRLTFRQLRACAEPIPSLTEVVERFGKRLHLMIEIKRGEWSDIRNQSRTLREALAPLRPVVDYHLMVLDPSIMAPLSGLAPSCMIAIAYHWPYRLSRWVLEHRWGGLATHYSMLRRTLIRRHHTHGQGVGCAFPASRNSLFRELNRGVDFIFSNCAGRLQKMLVEALIQAQLHCPSGQTVCLKDENFTSSNTR
ncbi:glycerophosphodiester phosphodiesterase [Desulfatitalea tepidiphila]|uniref:glycerophosphodiester phosphodiesterase n=1 Tax=Desulfatitalea tepidiphila TaxID=1185843 RepID=UPI0013792B36|nr:glycerophosphodiester phosphodiesterase family protein [Desulfatitalea tepidiphila]